MVNGAEKSNEWEMKREEEPEAERRNIHGWRSGGIGKEWRKKNCG